MAKWNKSREPDGSAKNIFRGIFFTIMCCIFLLGLVSRIQSEILANFQARGFIVLLPSAMLVLIIIIAIYANIDDVIKNIRIRLKK